MEEKQKSSLILSQVCVVLFGNVAKVGELMAVALRCIEIPSDSINFGCWSWRAVHGPFYGCLSVCCLGSTNQHIAIGGRE